VQSNRRKRRNFVKRGDGIEQLKASRRFLLVEPAKCRSFRRPDVAGLSVPGCEGGL